MAARTTGRSHLILDQPCQDRFACSVKLPGRIIIAVADGAGSATFAELGAELAVETVVRELERAFTSAEADPVDVVRRACAVAREAVTTAALDAGVSPRDYACTLLVATLGPEGGAAAQIGDGLIALRDDDENWSWVFWPQRGEYANVTRFLIEEDALEALECAPLRADVRDLAVMTDGLEPLALHYETRTAHDPFFEGLAPHLRISKAEGVDEALSSQLETFLASPRLSERVDDDLTLVLATRQR